MGGKNKVLFSNFYFSLLEGYQCRKQKGENQSLCHMICRELCHLKFLCKLQRYWI